MTAQESNMPDSTTEEQAIEKYQKAKELARGQDYLGWRELVKPFSSTIDEILNKWRNDHKTSRFSDYNQVQDEVEKVCNDLAPLFAIALAGVESENRKFQNQRSLLDYLLNIRGWDYAGLVIIVELPETLAYIYQGLHGAMCMSTGQYKLALELADTKIKRRIDEQFKMLWELPGIIGWPETLGGCTSAWEFLSKRAEKWEWLSEVFGSSKDYRESLAAYYMALNVHELAWHIARSPDTTGYLRDRIELRVPLCFMQESPLTRDNAFRQLVRHRESIDDLWTTVNVSRIQVERHWVDWLGVCHSWLRDVYPRTTIREIAHADLFSAI